MGMCSICGGWDCEFCNPHDLAKWLRETMKHGNPKAAMQKLLDKYEEQVKW